MFFQWSWIVKSISHNCLLISMTFESGWVYLIFRLSYKPHLLPVLGVYLCIKPPHTKETGDRLLPKGPLGLRTARAQGYLLNFLKAKNRHSQNIIIGDVLGKNKGRVSALGHASVKNILWVPVICFRSIQVFCAPHSFLNLGVACASTFYTYYILPFS